MGSNLARALGSFLLEVGQTSEGTEAVSVDVARGVCDDGGSGGLVGVEF